VTGKDDLRRIKYGTIGLDNAIRDLTEWKTFGLAGRLQKPVLPFINESDPLWQAMQSNLK
jgi:hypothetical protein